LIKKPLLYQWNQCDQWLTISKHHLQTTASTIPIPYLFPLSIFRWSRWLFFYVICENNPRYLREPFNPTSNIYIFSAFGVLGGWLFCAICEDNLRYLREPILNSFRCSRWL